MVVVGRELGASDVLVVVHLMVEINHETISSNNWDQTESLVSGRLRQTVLVRPHQDLIIVLLYLHQGL